MSGYVQVTFNYFIIRRILFSSFAKSVWRTLYPSHALFFSFFLVLAASSCFLCSLSASFACNLLRFHTLWFSFQMLQRPGRHPQPISEQQYRVTGGMYGVFRHEERHAVRTLRTHRHLLPLLATCQEVSHLQGSGPVKNQGIKVLLLTFPPRGRYSRHLSE